MISYLRHLCLSVAYRWLVHNVPGSVRFVFSSSGSWSLTFQCTFDVSLPQNCWPGVQIPALFFAPAVPASSPSAAYPIFLPLLTCERASSIEKGPFRLGKSGQIRHPGFTFPIPIVFRRTISFARDSKSSRVCRQSRYDEWRKNVVLNSASLEDLAKDGDKRL
jgi:hypothetical protein